MENRKVKLTKRLIKESMIELLKEKSIDKITVKELAERADINRSTFYTHYCDVYAVMEEMANDFISHIPFSEGKNEMTAEEIEKSFVYCCQNKDLCIALLKNGYYKKYLFEKSKEIFEKGTLQNGKMKDADEEIYLAMVSYTCSGMEGFLIYCLENEVNISAESFGKIFYSIDEYCRNVVVEFSKKQ